MGTHLCCLPHARLICLGTLPDPPVGSMEVLYQSYSTLAFFPSSVTLSWVNNVGCVKERVREREREREERERELGASVMTLQQYELGKVVMEQRLEKTIQPEL